MRRSVMRKVSMWMILFLQCEDLRKVHHASRIYRHHAHEDNTDVVFAALAVGVVYQGTASGLRVVLQFAQHVGYLRVAHKIPQAIGAEEDSVARLQAVVIDL